MHLLSTSVGKQNENEIHMGLPCGVDGDYGFSTVGCEAM